MTNLSPAAQAVMIAVLQLKFGEESELVDFPRMSRILGPELAAALRAVADAVAPIAMPHRRKVREELYGIATQLEQLSDD